MSFISIEEAEQIAIEFVKKKRNPKEITVHGVAEVAGSVLRVNGTYTDSVDGKMAFEWEVKISKASKKVLEYNIP